MIEILVKATPGPGALNGGCEVGFPVAVAVPPHNWGGDERPPTFARIRVTDTDDVTEWLDLWNRKTAYEILVHDPATDFFRVRIFSDFKTPTKSEMEDFLVNWGATKVEDGDGVVFEITAMDGINGKGLFSFGDEDEFVTCTETSYDPVTGTHTIAMDYSLSNLSVKQVEDELNRAHFTILDINHEQGVCVFTGERAAMVQELERQVATKFDTVIARVRWRFSDAAVAAAVAGGGVLEMTMAEADADMVDVATEV